jgi:hypothetical protein
MVKMLATDYCDATYEKPGRNGRGVMRNARAGEATSQGRMHATTTTEAGGRAGGIGRGRQGIARKQETKTEQER